MSLFNRLFREKFPEPRPVRINKQLLPVDQAIVEQSQQIFRNLTWAVDPGTEKERLEERFILAAAMFGSETRRHYCSDEDGQSLPVIKEGLTSYILELFQYAKERTDNPEELYEFKPENIQAIINHYDRLGENIQLLLDKSSRSYKNPLQKIYHLRRDSLFIEQYYPVLDNSKYSVPAFISMINAFNEASKKFDAVHLQRIGTEMICIGYSTAPLKPKEVPDHFKLIRTHRLCMAAVQVIEILDNQNMAINNGHIDHYTIAAKAGVFLGEELYKLCFLPEETTDEDFANDQSTDILENYYSRMLYDFGEQGADIESMPAFSVFHFGVAANLNPERPHKVKVNVPEEHQPIEAYLEYKMANQFIRPIIDAYNLTQEECVNLATCVADFAMKEFAMEEKESAARLVIYPALQISKVPIIDIDQARAYYVPPRGRKLFDSDRRLAHKACMAMAIK